MRMIDTETLGKKPGKKHAETGEICNDIAAAVLEKERAHVYQDVSKYRIFLDDDDEECIDEDDFWQDMDAGV